MKLLCLCSDELRILKYLYLIKLSDNPTIPLIEMLRLNLETFIVLSAYYKVHNYWI